MASPADLVLGTMYFGTRTDEATSFALLDRFVEAGGRTLDTANCYAFWQSGTGAGGTSETVIGRWLASNPGLREELVIATKVGQEPVTPGEFSVVEGLAPEVVARELDRSRERLGVDVIDVYWAHGEDRGTPLEDVVAAFGGAVREGVVRRIGLSNHPTWRVERARGIAARDGWEPFSLLQLTTSYVRPRPDVVVPGKDHRFGFVTDETVDYLTENPDLELWAYSPLVQGSYDRPERPFPQEYDHPGTTRRLSALSDVADRLGASRGQVVLAWLLASTPVARPILGVSSLDQLDQALTAAELDLSPDLMADLDGVS
ncbi:aldo/keto reductase [Mobilicoccus caccae]|uniref:Oxidoreductase n=1 Tax=Mobilicoccus caccae TaxID=1859295 RepID=A0ABQ6INC5_9MICO|nr:aldo/keto reductase [Mobilicoccus caccae]GMA38959.1 oxidoreductase [Mobilicoccus caccae]